MAGSTPMLLSKDTQSAILQFFRNCADMAYTNYDIKGKMELLDRVYLREMDQTQENLRAKAANSAGNTDRIQNLQMPVGYPAVEEAVSYQTSVFLTGVPLFGVASEPATMDEAIQMETLVDNQAAQGAWKREFMLGFRDGFKYNLLCYEVDWCRKVTSTVETDVTFADGKQGKPKQVIWEGNRVRRKDLYNTFWDTRVLPTKIHEEGEFAGYVESMSRIALKKFIAELPDAMTQNVKAAFESGTQSETLRGSNAPGCFYVPQLTPNALVDPIMPGTTNWLSWSGEAGAESKINYKDNYEVVTLYGRILPIDFGMSVPERKTPQIWKFIIVNQQVLIYAERQTNAHGWLPMFFGQPKENGLGYQDKSLLEDTSPMQAIQTALMNSILAARRRAISDRGLYDPSRVTEANINAATPTAKIPVRPSAYGKPVSEAYFPIPFRDENSGVILQELGQLATLTNQITGQNPARRGQFVKGNKTRREFDTVMANSNGRDQMTAILLEEQVLAPIKTVLLLNNVQYQAGVSLYSRDKERMIQIDPVKLRKAALQFKLTDGLIPSEKEMDTDSFTVALQTLGSAPAISQGYNLAPLFSFIMKSRGANLKPFEKPPEQVAYEQAMAQWQQLVMEMAKTGVKDYPPQPLPQAYGYDPTQTGVPTQLPEGGVTVKNQVNNVTQNNLGE